jgi:hypothetical protein
VEIQNVDADGEKPSFVPTPDVVKAMIREGVLTGAPSGKRDFAAMQRVQRMVGAERLEPDVAQSCACDERRLVTPVSPTEKYGIQTLLTERPASARGLTRGWCEFDKSAVRIC